MKEETDRKPHERGQFRITPTEKQREFITSTSKFSCFSGGFGNGKCVKNVLIYTRKGLEYVNNIMEGDEIASVGDDGEIVFSRVRKLIDAGKKDNYEVTLKNGLKIGTSEIHPYLKLVSTKRIIDEDQPTTINGQKNDRRVRVVDKVTWQEVKDLKKGDLIAINANCPEGEKIHGEDWMFVFGVALGDGTFRGSTPTICNSRKAVHKKILESGKKMGEKVWSSNKRTIRFKKGKLYQQIKDYGLWNKKSVDKWIPKELFGATKKEKAALLSGLLTTDGWVDNNYAGFSSASEKLCDGVHTLFLQLGILASKSKKTIWYKGKKKTYYHLQVSDKESVKKLQGQCDLLDKQPKLDKLAKASESKVARGRNKRFRWGDVAFIRIKKIEKKEPVQMYDLEIEGTHNFIANNIVAHNTFGGCLRSLVLSQYPGNFGLIGRLTYPELRDTTRRSFFEICPPELYDPNDGGEWRKSENHLRLTNGSEIIFRHLDNVSEKELLSLNLGWFYIDQAEEVSEQVFMILQSRLRLNTVPKRYGFITCNPEPGNWIYHRFKKPADEGTLQDDYDIIEAPSYDNPHLPKDYLESLRNSYPEAMQKRFIEGEWDVFEGQIFTEFSRKIHVIQPFDIPKGWEKIVSIDHGMVNPTAALFLAIDYDGNVFVFDEYYSPGIVSEHARHILERARGLDISFWLIDPSTQAKTREKDGMPWSILQEYEDHGIYATPANNELLAGINRVKEFMRVNPKRRHPLEARTGSPRLFIFANCVNLIGELPQYQWKKMRSLVSRNKPEVPRDLNDHAIDALRYAIMSRFPAPSKINRGNEMVMPWQRRNANSMTKQDNFNSNDMLGGYGGLPVDVEL